MIRLKASLFAVATSNDVTIPQIEYQKRALNSDNLTNTKNVLKYADKMVYKHIKNSGYNIFRSAHLD